MKTFHGRQEIKDSLLEKLRAHAKADQFVKGKYWENGKGCAVGCTVESDDHSLYESRFGIPVMLARFEDLTFEGLSNELAMTWPIRFIESIPVGKDLSNVGWQMLAWIVRDCNPVASSSTREVLDILDAMGRGEAVCQQRINDASYAARDASDGAWAARAARQAIYATRDAIYALRAARALRAASWAVSNSADFWQRASEKLLQLLKEVK